MLRACGAWKGFRIAVRRNLGWSIASSQYLKMVDAMPGNEHHFVRQPANIFDRLDEVPDISGNPHFDNREIVMLQNAPNFQIWFESAHSSSRVHSGFSPIQYSANALVTIAPRVPCSSMSCDMPRLLNDVFPNSRSACSKAMLTPRRIACSRMTSCDMLIDSSLKLVSLC